MTLAEALSRYFASVASNSNPYTHQELNRFARTLGPERPIDQLRPPDVASYAEGVVAAGADIQGRLAPLKEFLAFLRKEGLSKYSLAPHVKIPRSSMKAAGTSKQGYENIPMTETGIGMLREELDSLKGQRGDIVEAIRMAAADKDFRENAPLDAAKENQGKAEARIREIEEMLRRAVIMDTSADKSNRVRVGATVVLQDLNTGKNVSYTLVDSTEADPVAGKISVVSPMGRAVLGARKGDEVKVQAPKGERRYKLASITF